MGNYSYTEIQDMQKRAMERVREMKRNSEVITQSAQKDFDYQGNKTTFPNNVTPKVTNMPPNFPQETPYPSFKTVFEAEKPVNQNKEKPKPKPSQEKRNNLLESLFAEPDKALLLGLIMLLKSEKADESLVLALTYILS